MDLALSDVTVLDLGQVIAMPFCTMLLADLGARVIKVESRERGRERLSLGIKRTRDGRDERVAAAQYRERNKLAITLELKTERAIQLFKELVRHADVVTENFSVGTMDRLGLGYEALRAENPGLVYASITAFGQHGPVRGPARLRHARPGHQRLHEHHGLSRRPADASGQSISDYYAGMLCAFSIVSALHYRHRTGKGQHIDLALLDSLVVALDNLGERYTVGGELLTRAGNVSFGGSSSGVYPTTDGHVAIAAGASDAVWRRFCEIIGRADLTRDPASPPRPPAATGAMRRRHHPGLDRPAHQGRGGERARHRRRARRTRQQRGRDGGRPAGAGARDVRGAAPSRARPREDHRHAARRCPRRRGASARSRPSPASTTRRSSSASSATRRTTSLAGARRV